MFISFLSFLSLSIAFGVWRRIVVTMAVAIEKQKKKRRKKRGSIYEAINCLLCDMSLSV